MGTDSVFLSITVLADSNLPVILILHSIAGHFLGQPWGQALSIRG